MQWHHGGLELFLINRRKLPKLPLSPKSWLFRDHCHSNEYMNKSTTSASIPGHTDSCGSHLWPGPGHPWWIPWVRHPPWGRGLLASSAVFASGWGHRPADGQPQDPDLWAARWPLLGRQFWDYMRLNDERVVTHPFFFHYHKKSMHNCHMILQWT